MGEIGALKMPLEILEEITEGSALEQWLKVDDTHEALKLDEDVDPSLV
jgi:hypothetical protein